MAGQQFAPDETWAPPANSGAKACCKDCRNLETIERRPDVQVRRCRVCGCRHFRALILQPGAMQVADGRG